MKYAKVFPLSGTLDFKVPSKWYRRVVGSLEIICGLAMAIVPSRKKAFFKKCIQRFVSFLFETQALFVYTSVRVIFP